MMNFTKILNREKERWNTQKILHEIDILISRVSTNTSKTLSVSGFALVVVPFTAGFGNSVAFKTNLVSKISKKKETFKTIFQKLQF